MRSRPAILFTLLTFALLSAACQGASAFPTSTPLSFSSNSIIPTSTPLPTNTPTVYAPVQLLAPAFNAPTLAPFPLSAAQLQPTPASAVSISQPAASNAPLALARFDHFYFSWPVASGSIRNAAPSQRYGVIDPAFESTDAHLGLDLSMNSGTAVLAAAPGKVVWASFGLLYNSQYFLDDPYGIAVVILHDFGVDGQKLYTVYAHLREAKVGVGDEVQRGQLIALSGSTGQSSGAHLHFEVRLGTNTIYFTRNPELWLAPAEGRGALVGRVESTFGGILINRLVEVRSLDTGKRHTMYTYASEYRVQPDANFGENFVLGELPAGSYEIRISYFGAWRTAQVEIKPGAMTYFKFKGMEGYTFAAPDLPLPANLPTN